MRAELSCPLRTRGRVLIAAAALLAVLSTMALSTAPSSASGAAGVTQGEWLGYHGAGREVGTAAGIQHFSTSARRWTSPQLDGDVYGEPLVYRGDVIVATQNDSLYALSTTNGRIVWRRHLATAVLSSMLPCGDISPQVGITGTPVIDPSRHEVFALAFTLSAGRATHMLFGLDLRSGAVMLREPVPTPTPDQTPYLNRSGLALSQGKVIYSFGGNYGDCGTYHGVLGELSESSRSTATSFVVDSAPGQREGAIWMGGAAPVVDGAGNIWVTSGNGSVTSAGQPYDHSDAILELTASMRLKSFFAPASWFHDNAADADLSAEPALVGAGLVVATGKSGNIYLLNANHLGGIGAQIMTLASQCGNVLDGGVAITGQIVYVPCVAGTEAIVVRTNPARVAILWHAKAGSGPPIVAGGRVWTIGSDNVLYGLSPTSGAILQRATLSDEANHFPTPSVGAGLLLAPIARGVVAFAAT